MRFDDRLLGLALALLAAFVVVQAVEIPAVPGATFGPSLMPTIVGLVMGGCGLIVFAKGVRARAPGPLVDVSVWKGEYRGLACAAWAIGGAVAGIVFLPWLGFPLFGLLYALPLMLMMGARPLAAVPVALVVVLGAYLAFKQLLYVPLPAGPLTFLG